MAVVTSRELDALVSIAEMAAGRAAEDEHMITPRTKVLAPFLDVIDSLSSTQWNAIAEELRKASLDAPVL